MAVVRSIGRVVVLVEDQEQALRFYRDVLDFVVLHDETVDGLRLLHVGPEPDGGDGLWLLPPQSPEEHALVGRQTGDEPLLVLYADDLDAVLDRLQDEEIEHWGLRDEGPARSVHLEDDAGNVLVVVEQPESVTTAG